jgi:hypothetical protein
MIKTLKVSYIEDWNKPYIRISGYWLKKQYGICPGDDIKVELLEDCLVIRRREPIGFSVNANDSVGRDNYNS